MGTKISEKPTKWKKNPSEIIANVNTISPVRVRHTLDRKSSVARGHHKSDRSMSVNHLEIAHDRFHALKLAFTEPNANEMS